MKTIDDVYLQTREEILEVGHKHKIEASKLERFLISDRFVRVKIPVTLDNKKIKTFVGFRSQHDNKLGPYKGGIRFHTQVSEHEVMALSIWMSLKCAIAQIPFGGGKGGIIVDPKELSEKELERLSREYVRRIYDVIGPTKDVPAPDVNTNPKIMEWMIDEYIKISKDKKDEVSEHVLASTFTGKPISFYGLEGRTEATGFGGVSVLKELVKKLGKKSDHLTIAIQGFGNVGYYFAKFASEAGFNVIAVSDSKGGITNKGKDVKPLDIPLVIDCKKKKGVVAGCYCVGGVCDLSKGRPITNEELLELPVDILVPAALENVINSTNMRKIKAKIIIEMANGPTSIDAYKYLSKKGVVIVPDVLSNSGGVTGSYFEWKQNLENKKYKKQETLTMLDEKMKYAFRNIWNISIKEKIDLKEAAYLYAIKKLA